MNDEMNDKRLVIVTGHYGSGKTEFAVNYAVKMSKEHNNVCLADLDIVNPYFRSREKRSMLEAHGIKVCDSNLKNNNAVDLPALPPEVAGFIQNKDLLTILDVGGDPVGARVLARYASMVRNTEHDLFLVVNANRPETQTKEQAVLYLRAIEKTSGLKVTGLVNNTHLLKDTSCEDVMRGHRLAREVSEATGVPVRYEAVTEMITSEIEDEEINKFKFPIHMYMREDWMS